MSERDDRYAGNDPISTAEFRAAPDISASTAQFKAFAQGQDVQQAQRGADGSWPEQPWAGDMPSRGSGRRTALIVGVIVAVAVVMTILLVVR